MGSKTEKRTGGGRRLAAGSARHAARAVRWSLSTCLALLALAAAIALVAWMRLQQGPLHIPFVAEMIAERVNQANDRVSIAIEGLEFTLGDASRPSRLEFTGVEVRGRDQVPLIAVPRVAARFAMADLLAGRIQPTAITIDGAAARVVRTEEGRIRLALSERREPPGPRSSGRSGRAMDTVEAIVDGFVGDGPEAPELARLDRVAIENADLTYLNEATGRSWRSEQAQLALTRTPEGATMTVELAVLGDRAGVGEPGATLAVTASRQRGTGETRLVAAFDRVDPGDLAAEVPELGWLDAVDAPLGGRLEATVARDGELRDLGGALVAAGGEILAVGDDAVRFDRFAVQFSYEPGLRRMRVDTLNLLSPVADLSMSGFADLATEPGGRVTGLAAQLDISRLTMDVPALFAEAQSFESGRVVARIDLDGPVVEVAEARLAQGPLRVSVSGQVRPGAGGWIGDMRIAGEAIAVERLVALWPLRAASGARKWLAKNLKGGTVDEVLAHLRLGEGDPKLNLDFRFSDLSSGYLKEMSPIVRAYGRGHLSWERMDLFVDRAEVEPVEGAPIRLDGSTVTVTDIFEKSPPGEIFVRGEGPTASALALLDQEPLGFISKLDLDPASVDGRATMTAALRFPLDDDLKVKDVEVDAAAELHDVRMPFSTPLTGTLAIAADHLELVADTDRMQLDGAVTADGTPLALEWEERYSGNDKGRDIGLVGVATPKILRDINLDIPGFDGGTAPIELLITQAKGRPSTFQLSADLGPAAVSVEPVLWRKPAGKPATVTAKGTFGKGPTVIETLALDGPGLAARGELTLYPDGGGVERARIWSLDMGRLADLTVEARARGPNLAGYDLSIEGRHFDIAFFERAEPPDDDDPVVPLGATYRIETVRLSENIALDGVEGDFSRTAEGTLRADLTGRVEGKAPVSISYVAEQGEPGKARLSAADAGRVLEAAGLFTGAEGGTLKVDATIAPDAQTSLRGTAVLKDIVVQQEARTFRRVLEQGELPQIVEETQTTGITFSRVEVPFAVRGSRITIDTALATSPALAIKVAGTVNDVTGRLTLRGVISPAYALTGMLNNVPLLGALLGGEGEGIFAMTFAVDGTTDDPAISVNPVSLLAPGFLRNLFETDAFANARPKTAAERIADAAARTEAPPPRTAAEKEAADAEQAERLKQLLESDF